MLTLKKAICLAMSVVLAVMTLSSCGGSYKEEYIYFELLEKPQTLDPQTASSDSELLVARNIYEGLLRRDQSGEIVGGVSESYSYENLTYTFKLDEDACWSNGDRVTAHDFVFAFRRALDPNIKAPFASRLMCIKGAAEVNSGSADVFSLGVSAPDDSTFIIKLAFEDSDFLETLTTSVCMPCNEKFFEESIGKYGLDKDYIISNGSYRLTKWNKEDFGIRLYKNEEYKGIFEAENAAVFISCAEDETQLFRLSEGESDMAFIPCEELEEVNKTDFTVKDVQNICWVMTVSDNYSAEVREALALSFSKNNFAENLSDGYTAATSLYPEILDISEDTAGVGLTVYDINSAKTIMSEQVAGMEDKHFPSATLYYYDTPEAKSIATGILGHWQLNLSTFVNIQPSDSLTALQAELGAKTLDFSLFPVSAKSDIYDEYIRQFTLDFADKTPAVVQQELLSENTLFPVAFQNTNIAYMPELENVNMEQGNGYIDFSFIIKR